MRILIPGGSGQVGTLLARHLHANGHQVTVLSRNPQPAPWRTLAWDGLNPGPWVEDLNRADTVIHLSGRTVNCRYTPEHRREIIDSRVLPTLLLGRLIAASPTPPRIWLNASSATGYRHAAGAAIAPNDEFTGVPSDLPSEHAAGGVHEAGNLPKTHGLSPPTSAIAGKLPSLSSDTPHTRKIRLPHLLGHVAGCRRSLLRSFPASSLAWALAARKVPARNTSHGFTISITAAPSTFFSRNLKSPTKPQASSTWLRPTPSPIVTSCAICAKPGINPSVCPPGAGCSSSAPSPCRPKPNLSLNLAASFPASCSSTASNSPGFHLAGSSARKPRPDRMKTLKKPYIRLLIHP